MAPGNSWKDWNQTEKWKGGGGGGGGGEAHGGGFGGFRVQLWLLDSEYGVYRDWYRSWCGLGLHFH